MRFLSFDGFDLAFSGFAASSEGGVGGGWAHAHGAKEAACRRDAPLAAGGRVIEGDEGQVVGVDSLNAVGKASPLLGRSIG